MSVFPYYSATVKGRGFHTHESCPMGARIPRDDRRPGDGGLLQCTVCVTLDELQQRMPAPPPTQQQPSTAIPEPRLGTK